MAYCGGRKKKKKLLRLTGSCSVPQSSSSQKWAVCLLTSRRTWTSLCVNYLKNKRWWWRWCKKTRMPKIIYTPWIALPTVDDDEKMSGRGLKRAWCPLREYWGWGLSVPPRPPSIIYARFQPSPSHQLGIIPCIIRKVPTLIQVVTIIATSWT